MMSLAGKEGPGVGPKKKIPGRRLLEGTNTGALTLT